MLPKKDSKTNAACVGVDIGSHSIKAVELIHESDDLMLRAADSIPTPAGAIVDGCLRDKNAVASALRHLWKRAGFISREAVTGLDLRQLHIRWHHLETETPEALDETARQAAVRGLTYPAYEAITEYRVLSTRDRNDARQMHHLTLIAARATLVEDVLDMLERAGIEPAGVDVAPLAISRSSLGNRRGMTALWNGQPQAHCVVGAESTLICVVREGGVEFARSIPVGATHITQALTSEIGCQPTTAEEAKCSQVTRLEPTGVLKVVVDGKNIEVSCEAVLDRLVREIGRSLMHFQSQFPEGSYLGMIGGITLSGGGALLRGFDKYLADRLSDEIRTLNPFAGLPVLGTRFGIDRVQGSAAAFGLAMGLAAGWHELSGTMPHALRAA